jgi:hypothetical protein
MSLTYTGTNGLFTHLGKLVKHYNQFQDDAIDGSTGLNADRKEILDAFQASDQDLAIDGLVQAYERWKSEYVARRALLAAFALARLEDRTTVLDEIGAATTDPGEILAKLLETMNEDAATIESSVVSVGSVSADGDNAGGGVILSTNVLDGATSPGAINGVVFPSQVKYDGLTTELCAPSQRFVLRVAADSFHDDLDEGSEEIAWEGMLPDDPHGISEDGTGVVATIQPIHADTPNHVSNADFESFTSNVPDDWTLVSGVAGTNVLAATSAQAAHGSDALLFQGNASATAIEIKQAIPKSNVIARKRYCVTVKLKKNSASTGTVTIQFEGTGYTAGGSEKISVNASSLATSYALHHFFVTMPAVIPTDFRLVIRWNGGTPGSSEKVYIDDLGVGPVYYGGGVGVVAVRNSGAFARDDRFEFTVTNTEGVFQTFFRRAFGVQLPSDASPTISDTLAG